MKQQRENNGVLFRNDRRTKETHPEYTGSLNVEGREYWLSAWVKEGDGRKFFSLAVKPKEERAAASKPAREEMDDEIPF